MAAGFYETGAQLFARLGTKPNLENLDDHLFPKPQLTLTPGNIVELYGTSGCAKTEVLYHLIAQCILPTTWKGIQMQGLNIGVVFVDTEYQFSMLRLFAIVEKRIAQSLERMKLDQSRGDREPGQTDAAALPTCDQVEGLIKAVLSKLYVVKCSSSEQFIITLHSLESLLANNPEINLMMLDCVSAFYWTDRTNAGDNTANQEAMQRRMTNIIQRLINEYQLVLIATKPAIVQRKQRLLQHEPSGSVAVAETSSPGLNQSFSDAPRGGPDEVIEHHEYMCHAWHRLVTHRFHIERRNEVVSDKDRMPKSIFKARLIHPSTMKHQVLFCITESGVSYTEM